MKTTISFDKKEGNEESYDISFQHLTAMQVRAIKKAMLKTYWNHTEFLTEGDQETGEEMIEHIETLFQGF